MTRRYITKSQRDYDTLPRLHATPQTARHARDGETEIKDIVLVVNIDALERHCETDAPAAERHAADQHNFEIAERLSVHYASELDRLRQIIGLVPAPKPERTVAQLESEIAIMRPIVEAACKYVGALGAGPQLGARGVLVDAVSDYRDCHRAAASVADREIVDQGSTLPARSRNRCPTCESAADDIDCSEIGPYRLFRRVRFRCSSCGYHWVESDDGEVLVPQLRPVDIGVLVMDMNLTPGGTFSCASCGVGHDRGPVAGGAATTGGDTYRCLRCDMTGRAGWSWDNL